MEHPAIRHQQKLNQQSQTYEALEQNTALIPLFKFYGKSFESDIDQRSQWGVKLKDLGYGNKEISKAIDEIVTIMDKFPSFAEFLKFIPRNEQKQTIYSDVDKSYQDDTKKTKELREQFKNVLCDGDDEKYKELMNRVIIAWLKKVYDYTDQEVQSVSAIVQLSAFEKCVLFDWRDSGFNPKTMFESGARKRVNHLKVNKPRSF